MIKKADTVTIITVIICTVLIFLFGMFIGTKREEYKTRKVQVELDQTKEELAQYTISDDELLPCPFCGSEDVEFKEYCDDYYVFCNNCFASGTSWDNDTSHDTTKEEARDNWNKVKR